MTFYQRLMWLSGVLRSMSSFPVRFIFGLLGVPNFRIVYKSGHVEYWFFKKIDVDRKGSEITALSWEVFPSCARPLHMNVEEIESIIELW